MSYDHVFAAVSGTSLDECHALVHRHPSGRDHRIDELQSRVIESEPGATQRLDQWDLALTERRLLRFGRGLHPPHRQRRSRRRRVGHGGRRRDGRRLGPHRRLRGVLGGDPTQRPTHNVMFRYDGRSWTEMPAPKAERDGQRVNVVRGTAPDCLVAAGNFGLLAHWDGHEWRHAQAPMMAHFSGLHVESPDELVAVAENGLIVEGSVNGWNQVLQTDEYRPSDIAKFAGRIFVAGQEKGLLEFEGNRLTVVKDNIPAKRVEASEQLLMTCPEVLGFSADGLAFESWFLEDLVPLILEAARMV